MFESLHLRHLARVDLGHGESAEVDLQHGIDGETTLYLVAEGVLTAELARTFAADLLNAADMLDGLSQ
jgi:hypothetical protein